MAGYSKRTLAEKLGYKVGSRAVFLNEPEGLRSLLGKLPVNTEIHTRLDGTFDIILLFVDDVSELESKFPELKKYMTTNGTVWISWRYKMSKTKSNVYENSVREIGQKHGFVDTKVVAIDQTWSGLKFTIKGQDR
jgi:hypothetical protein